MSAYKVKRYAAGFLCALSAVVLVLTLAAEGAAKVFAADRPVSQISAQAAVLYETTTQSVILEKESEKSLPMGHFAKLMAALVAAEKINANKLALTDIFTASKKANAQTGTVIWLDAGEEIAVLELLKAITIGNANDACVTLVEGMCGDEESYLRLANETAVRLELKATHFADACGLDEKTVSCAKDVAILCAELLKYDFLREYFLTWIDEVRGGKTQLVNTNRLVKSYNGITGLKACYTDLTGSCLAASAEREGLSLVAVIFGSESMEVRFADGKEYLDYGFNNYELFSPKLNEEVLKDIKVTNGVRSGAGVCVKKTPQMLILKGSSANVSLLLEREEQLSAPVKKGDRVGTVKFANDEGVIFETELYAAENVSQMTWRLALKRLLLNLLKLE